MTWGWTGSPLDPSSKHMKKQAADFNPDADSIGHPDAQSSIMRVAETAKDIEDHGHAAHLHDLMSKTLKGESERIVSSDWEGLNQDDKVSRIKASHEIMRASQHHEIAARSRQIAEGDASYKQRAMKDSALAHQATGRAIDTVNRHLQPSSAEDLDPSQFR